MALGTGPRCNPQRAAVHPNPNTNPFVITHGRPCAYLITHVRPFAYGYALSST